MRYVIIVTSESGTRVFSRFRYACKAFGWDYRKFYKMNLFPEVGKPFHFDGKEVTKAPIETESYNL